MRLACPNCGAQYEVPADAIPPEGRDVQCSACGRTWLERGAPLSTLPEADGIGFGEADPDELDRLAEGVPRVEGDDEEEDDLAEIGRPGVPWDEAPAPAPRALVPEPEAVWAPRSTVTPGVAEILRAEALRETTAREREREDAAPAPAARARPLMPPEPASLTPGPGGRSAGGATEGGAPLRSLQAVVEARRAAQRPPGAKGGPSAEAPGVPRPASFARERAPRTAEARPATPAAALLRREDAPVPLRQGTEPAPPTIAALSSLVLRRAEEARRRMARLRALAEAEAPREPAAQRSEPAASVALRPAPVISASAPAREASDAPRGRRSGFGRGFASVLALAAGLAALYVAAPRVTAALPATASVLGPFADAVDEGRLWLDLRVQALRGVLEGSGGNAGLAAPAVNSDASPDGIEGAARPDPVLVAPVGEAPEAPAAPAAETAPIRPGAGE